MCRPPKPLTLTERQRDLRGRSQPVDPLCLLHWPSPMVAPGPSFPPAAAVEPCASAGCWHALEQIRGVCLPREEVSPRDAQGAQREGSSRVPGTADPLAAWRRDAHGSPHSSSCRRSAVSRCWVSKSIAGIVSKSYECRLKGQGATFVETDSPFTAAALAEESPVIVNAEGAVHMLARDGAQIVMQEAGAPDPHADLAESDGEISQIIVTEELVQAMVQESGGSFPEGATHYIVTELPPGVQDGAGRRCAPSVRACRPRPWSADEHELGCEVAAATGESEAASEIKDRSTDHGSICVPSCPQDKMGTLLPSPASDDALPQPLLPVLNARLEDTLGIASSGAPEGGARSGPLPGGGQDRSVSPLPLASAISTRASRMATHECARLKGTTVSARRGVLPAGAHGLPGCGGGPCDGLSRARLRV
ncbi:hypothetical protein CB1_001033031 [Camelus ferus]|nr:hypothetical protein CB1_001033031 [Camelus ferus]